MQYFIGINMVFQTHASPGGPFWSKVYQGYLSFKIRPNAFGFMGYKEKPGISRTERCTQKSIWTTNKCEA